MSFDSKAVRETAGSEDQALFLACDEIDSLRSRLKEVEGELAEVSKCMNLACKEASENRADLAASREREAKMQKVVDAVKEYRSATTDVMPNPPSRQDREREAFGRMMIALVPFEETEKEFNSLPATQEPRP